MSQMTSTITRATTAAVPTVATVLARAFHQDPVFVWSIPDPDRRRARLPGVFTAFAELYLPYAESYLTSDGAGAALWAPTDVDPFEGERGQTFGMRIAQLLEDEETQRFFTVGKLFGEHHPAQPFMYLQLIGGRPRSPAARSGQPTAGPGAGRLRRHRHPGLPRGGDGRQPPPVPTARLRHDR